ncbi:hypothetical protein SAMN02745136_04218 [Anaerocolumna jejuensis DSM 15929]|uniref:Uncharacterized protein n=1 Tax=Anaerocolumna jejuensis DSM 15929 TaxID=1121322 RepID=A0A1M6YAL9_9FIRM|nr:hypothetical protein [Anaerocolumna jejuensis]SHL15055.1 hypothetical protein SAMN02745136_04218 [Anaerocolumna jejuensis DSM 15929]
MYHKNGKFVLTLTVIFAKIVERKRKKQKLYPTIPMNKLKVKNRFYGFLGLF